MAQSAVEWYAKEHHRLLIKLENKELTIGEYAGEHHDILQQAKQMNKQQIMHAYVEASPKLEDITIESAEQYYNETYTQSGTKES